MKNLSFIGYDKYCACRNGSIYSIRSGRFLIPVVQNNGYCHVTLSQDGRRNNFSVHRLIAKSFIPNTECKQTVNHKDGNKQNNCVDNLEWHTQQEQIHHALAIGLMNGTRNPDRSISDETAHTICKYISDSWRNKDIASVLGVDAGLVARIRYGTDYNDISCEYDFKNILPSRRKLNIDKLIRICEMLQEGKSYKDIRSEVGVSTATISNIKRRKNGIHISQNYEF